MEPTLETTPNFVQDLVGKKVRVRYIQRVEGGGVGAPYEGKLAGTDGTFLKLAELEGYQAAGFGPRTEVLVRIESLATVEEVR
jgi:hypothetical protein